ncbi:MAG: hypothetical protein RJA22_729 [Verrucomicrobiota bacterium]|jgi:hypothetical protein
MKLSSCLFLAAALAIGLPVSLPAAQGGGYLLAGLVGEYFANTNLAGTPGFTRRDVRLDFRQNSLPPGGAGQVGDLPFRSVPATGFSVRWTGRCVPRFTESYTFQALASGPVRLRLRPAGQAAWNTVLDDPAPGPGGATGSANLSQGVPCDLEVTFRHGDGPWSLRLLWSGPSTPLEVIDPVVQSGINNPPWTSGFTDIIKGARNSWEPVNGGTRPALDTNGWPHGDAGYYFQESLNHGMDLDPQMRGRVRFSFRGSAAVQVRGNVQPGSLTFQYHAASNLTTGSFLAASNGWNASFLSFTNSRRNGLPDGPPGFTDLRLMRPVAPDALASFDPDTTLFTPELLRAMEHFTVIRHQLVANQQRDWEERTRPGWFNQSGGAISPPHYGIGDPSDNGLSWEHKVLLANETGRDLMLSVPTLASGREPADTTSYLVRLARLIAHGSDGVEPYPSPVANPVYPPLNPNLRVYLELENELWNFFSVFYVDFANINAITAADADANNADFQVINFDGLSTAREAGGGYVSMNTWRYRKIMLRLIQMSDIFRSVFGDDAMMTRVRPLYEWQYANDNDTARLALTFADRYFNNGDGRPHVPNPRPVRHWLWGGGGATYYGAANGNGLTDLVPNPSFASPGLAPGYHRSPAGAGWAFTGNAGIAVDGGPGDDIPPAFRGTQMGYLTDQSSITISVTFPATVTSPVFGVSFKAVNRIPAGGSAANRQNVRVYLDGTNDITARTFSQGNGYTAPGYNPEYPWTANNVFWAYSDYYFTRSFTVEPGSTHTLTVRGLGDPANPGATNQTVFLGDVRVTSVDRIFEDGIPGGGEAAGQPVGQNIQQTMNVEASWAKAFGLEQVSYEGGWSLGGDDGGSWVQLKAKYGDPRTAEAQGRFMDMFHLAGSAINVFGTYAQWPTWADYYAEQGLLDISRYPIIQGIDDRASRLPPEAAQGVIVPATLLPAMAALDDGANASLGRITTAGGWIHWNVLSPRRGDYQVTVSPPLTHGTLLVNDLPVILPGQSTGSVALTKGLHSVKVRSVSTNLCLVSRITLAGLGAPPAPSLTAWLDGDGSVTLGWTPVAGATRYEIRHGTVSGFHTALVDAGTATSFTLTGLTNGLPIFVVVVAENTAGLSQPSNERGLIPTAAGQGAGLALWEFAGAAGHESNALPHAATARLSVSPLTRGPGLLPSTSEWAVNLRANRFASEPPASLGHLYASNLTHSITLQQFYQFTVAPVPGHFLSLSQLTFRAFFQNARGGAGLTFSTNGSTFITAPAPAGSPASSQTPWTATLASVPALQGLASPVIFRLHLHGLGPYEVSGLGDPAGSDLILIGSLQPVALPLSASRVAGPGFIQLAWATNSWIYHLETKPNLDPALPWIRLTNAPSLQDGQWRLTLPALDPQRFYRLVP